MGRFETATFRMRVGKYIRVEVQVIGSKDEGHQITAKHHGKKH